MRIATVVVLLALSCSQSHAVGAQPRFTKQTVSGLSIELIHPTKIEYFGFGDTGWVAVTLGRRGPNWHSVAPAAHWKIADGRVTIFDEEGVWAEITLLRVDGKILTVRRKAYRLGHMDIHNAHPDPEIVRYRILGGKV